MFSDGDQRGFRGTTDVEVCSGDTADLQLQWFHGFRLAGRSPGREGSAREAVDLVNFQKLRPTTANGEQSLQVAASRISFSLLVPLRLGVENEKSFWSI
jgi:hypothetical protein